MEVFGDMQSTTTWRFIDHFRHCFQVWYFSNLWHLKDKLVSQARCFPFRRVDCILDTENNQHCRMKRLVRLSQHLVSISKSRCSPLQTSMNWWYKGHWLGLACVHTTLASSIADFSYIIHLYVYTYISVIRIPYVCNLPLQPQVLLSKLQHAGAKCFSVPSEDRNVSGRKAWAYKHLMHKGKQLCKQITLCVHRKQRSAGGSLFLLCG